MMRPKTELELPVSLVRNSADTLQSQLVSAMRDAIHNGAWGAGYRVPSSRVMSASLKVARSTVAAAYEQLVGEGYLTSRHGSGTYVSDHLPSLPPAARRQGGRRDVSQGSLVRVGNDRVVDLRPGQPDTSRLLDAGWTRAWRQAAREPVPAVEPDRQGEWALREEIASHIRAARGLEAGPEQIFITAGTADALALLVHALSLAGRPIAVEDPGYPAGRGVLARLGCIVRPVPVDGDGLDVGRLASLTPVPAAVLVTPSHQYPLGGRLPVDRRLSLLSWAEAEDAVILEDDYDSEFRFGVPPLPALGALNQGGRVAHIGTFSKVLTPWLRLGYVVVPSALAGALREVRAHLDTPVSGLDQAAMAAYMHSGSLRRHIARTRRDYAHRRDQLHRLLSRYPSLQLAGLDAGLHAVIRLPTATDVAAVLAECEAAGFILADLAEYAVSPPSSAEKAVVLGYGAAALADLSSAVATLAAAARATVV